MHVAGIREAISCGGDPGPGPVRVAWRLGIRAHSRGVRAISNGIVSRRVRQWHVQASYQPFTRAPDGTIGAAAGELAEIGLWVPPGPPNRFVPLSALRGVKYEVNELKQTIAFRVRLDALATDEINIGPLRGSFHPVDEGMQSTGFLLNYDIYTQASHNFSENFSTFNGTSATLEARTFSRFGTLSQSGIVGNTTVESLPTATRLDTTYTYADPATEQVYHAGDTISGGLAWTRPIRLGGLQVQKDFSLRPDLVTMPLPSMSGSAAVPSALSLYVNGVQTYAQNVPAGPYQLNNIPVVTGAGDARVVLRDASGQQVQENVAFFSSSSLIRAGLYDYSVEVGAARLNYGVSSFTYDKQPAASASGRYGLTNWLTLEAHGEATRSLENLGAGFDVQTGPFGVASVAIAGSAQGANHGALLYGAYGFGFFGLTVNMEAEHTLNAYRDLAAVTVPAQYYTGPSTFVGGLQNGYYNFGSILPPTDIEQFSVSIPVGRWSQSVNLSLTRYVDATGLNERIASLSYNMQLPYNISLFATALHNFDGNCDSTFLAGLSMPLGHDISVSTSATTGSDGTRIQTQATKASGLDPGSYGWAISDSEGADPLRSVEADYRASDARLMAQVLQSGGGFTGIGEATGAVVFMPGTDIHYSPPIDDSFAIVKAGAPNVPVQIENRPVGVTGSDGELLVTGLHGYDGNKITIDGTNLPVNSKIGTTEEMVTPLRGSGSIVDFGVDVSARDAMVHFVDSNGKDIPAGTQGHIRGTAFVVGYDGLAYLTDVSVNNHVVLQAPAADCAATFDIDPTRLMQKVGPVVCR